MNEEEVTAALSEDSPEILMVGEGGYRSELPGYSIRKYTVLTGTAVLIVAVLLRSESDQGFTLGLLGESLLMGLAIVVMAVCAAFLFLMAQWVLSHIFLPEPPSKFYMRTSVKVDRFGLPDENGRHRYYEVQALDGESTAFGITLLIVIVTACLWGLNGF